MIEKSRRIWRLRIGLYLGRVDQITMKWVGVNNRQIVNPHSTHEQRRYSFDLTFIYRDNSSKERKMLWEKINEACTMSDCNDWLVTSDFN